MDAISNMLPMMAVTSTPRPAVPSIPSANDQQQPAAAIAVVAEAQQAAAPAAAASPVPTAEIYPLGTQSFAIFKDATGTLITRYRDELSGKVTYVPQAPQYLNTSASPTVTIQA